MLLGVDVGGTFTDAVLLTETGAVHTAKVPSTPADQSRGVLSAVERVLDRAQAQAGQVSRFAHGMTVATNALLEGNLARTALLVTEGFVDLIELGRQARPELYRLCAAPPDPLTPPERRFEVAERTSPDGPIRVLDQADAERLASQVASCAPEAIAIVLLHSYAHPAHEQLLGEALVRALPRAHISLSHDLVGTFREYERAATTEIDAALSPLLAGYLKGLCTGAREIGLAEPQVMQSSGGLIDAGAAAAHAALTVLSGPAGGVAGAQLLAQHAGEPDVLCLDMGGTSCDVCVISGGLVLETAQRTVAGRPLALPALDVHTVGAGGGSIAWADTGGALRVGPQSAGADPGPACYGHGGREPTVTDANLLLGRLPAEITLAGGVQLRWQAAHDAIATLASRLGLETMSCAEGIVRVAETEMLKALRVMSLQRGLDPRDFALMSFGGAGGLHAVALATELGVCRVLCPRASGVLSALGLAVAAPRRDVARTVMLSGAKLAPGPLDAARKQLCRAAANALGESPRRLRVSGEMRYRGQSFELAVDASPERGPDELCEAFASAHEQRYGYREDGAEIELVTLRVCAFGAAPEADLGLTRVDDPDHSRGSVVFMGERLEVSRLIGELPPGRQVEGPAVCALPEATVFVPPGWAGAVDTQGTLVLEVRE